jgi:NADH-quinone oxidoreductase subunit A
LVFDVEVAFMYPVVAVFRDWVLEGRGMFALLEISVFVAILVAGLIYVWAKGDLQWIKTVVVPHGSETEAAPQKGTAGGKYVAN